MTNQHTHNRLHRHMIQTLALESQLEQELIQLIEVVSEHPRVKKLFSEFYETVKLHRKTLEERLRSVVTDIEEITTTTLLSKIDYHTEYPVSTALQNLYVMFNQVIMAYTTLQPLTHRFGDSWVIGEYNTANISTQHTKNYAVALQKINHIIHDVIIWEMDQEGLECTCTCPACGVGICLCAVSCRSRLQHAWVDAGPILIDKGITVLPPKSESPASNASLSAGDVIIAVDGHELDFYGEIQDAIYGHKSGDEIKLLVQRQSGEQVVISLHIL